MHFTANLVHCIYEYRVLFISYVIVFFSAIEDLNISTIAGTRLLSEEDNPSFKWRMRTLTP